MPALICPASLCGQGAEIERKRAEVHTLLSTHRAAAQVPEGGSTVLEYDIALIQQQEDNNAVVAGLMRLAASDLQLAAELESKLAEADIQPPTDEETEGDGDDFLE